MSEDGPLVFVSHADEDKEVAVLLKDLIVEAAPFKVRVFVSSDANAQPLGIDWLKRIRVRLSEAAVVVFLASPSSLKASFALLEFGAALFNAPQPTIVPICINGLSVRELPDPLHRYHATEPRRASDLRVAVGSIVAACAGAPDQVFECRESVDWDAHHIDFRNAQEDGLTLDNETLSACSFDTLSRLEPLFPVGRGYAEDRLYSTLIGQALQSVTFDGSPIDDRFWAMYGRMIRGRQDWSSQKKLAYILSVVRQGKIVTAKKDSYVVMDLLRRQVHEYRATATDEEVLRPESKDFLFASASPNIFRLFILRMGKQTFDEFDEERRSALNAQIKQGVKVRVLKWDEDRSPPNFGIYGHIAVGRLSPAGINEIEFNVPTVHATKEEFDGLWLRGEEIFQV
ncbi:toll/interleukin-1 receptor domain-containing protein [Bradyrhizobium vignae]|uniref:TIR domain-containing protein n=1 Tax=Bradyrhizobium vignae TaxID=1549949 RepID=A0A2U3PV49_9BRAD|nr:toll/interleukin-1 receptor domain-containing protein [Bradyrhizobium vignae]SPP93041.1 protein of unknown function [Bradyrhizobium vignae]